MDMIKNIYCNLHFNLYIILNLNLLNFLLTGTKKKNNNTNDSKFNKQINIYLFLNIFDYRHLLKFLFLNIIIRC